METISSQLYKQNYHRLKEHITKREQRKKQEKQLKDFNFLSANLSNFLPTVPVSSHENIYYNILYNNSRLVTEPSYPDLINNINRIGDTSCLEQQTPAIYCTYHLGSYRSIIGVLASAGIDFVLLVDQNTYNKQHIKVTEIVNSIHANFNQSSYFGLEAAEQHDIAIRLFKHIRSGRSVVAYLDGNTGVGGIYKKDPQFLNIPFLHQNLYSRKGITTLSYAAKVPVIPVISWYDDHEQDVKLKFYDPINPLEWTKGKEDYCYTVTSYLYKILEEKLLTYYDQWEGWLYVHKYLDWDNIKRVISIENTTDNGGAVENLVFNKTEYSLFKLDENCFLFNRASYSAYEINEELLSFLDKRETVNPEYSIAANLSDSLLQNLIEKRVLIQSKLAS
ncbi:MAG: hypothetical protein CMO01_33180 [Thalassobius sp.]|nr:hypothetical protein [Thalassovita sp.]